MTQDPQLLGAAAAGQVLLAALAGLVGGAMFVLWIVAPNIVSTNPGQMQWNSAFCVLFLAGSMLSVRTRPVLAVVLSVPALVVAGSAFAANMRGVSGAIEHLVPASVPVAAEPGHMGNGPALLSIGLGVLPLLYAVYVHRPAVTVKWAISVVTSAVVMAVIALFGAQMFSLVEITVQSESAQGFRQGNFGYGALVISWVCVWVLDGQWRPLLSEGISATALRWLTVVAIALPIIPGTLLTFAAANGWLEPMAIVSLMAGFVAAGGLAVAARVYCALRTLEGALIEQALVDELTGLWNLGAFRRLAEQQFAEARRHGDAITIVVFDLDGLKVVNDTYGHAAGSEMIRAMAQAISLAIREEDVPARIGGDEFALVTRASSAAALNVVARVRTIARDFDNTKAHAWSLNFSTGLATGTGASDLDDLIQRADIAMYEDKAERRRLRGEFDSRSV